MKKKGKRARLWGGVPPWVLIGAAIVMLPIFAVNTLENIRRQKENTTRLLLEKGAALIRAIEAGTRTGLMWNEFSGRQLQNLLAETAFQKDIAYILVVDRNGIIKSHSKVSQIGKTYGSQLNLKMLSRIPDIRWRLIERSDGEKIFEVFRRFSPSGRDPTQEWLQEFFEDLGYELRIEFENASALGSVIFIGLEMSTIEEAGKADIRHAVIISAVILLLGFAGIVLLFLTHNYRVARASLSRIKAFSDNLVEHMPIGLIVMDSKKKVASYNNVAGRIFGFLSGSVIGKDAKERLPDALLEQMDDPEIQSTVVEKEVECRLGEGDVVPLQLSASVLNDDNDNFFGYVLLFKDLSEIQSLKKIVARSQRLATVGRLAAGVAHEIRNPLSSIKGFATYFKERYRDVPEDQQTADIMVQEVDRLNRVVGQLLEFARPVTVSEQPTDIRTLVENSLKLVEKQTVERGIRIETRLPGGGWKVMVDPDKISQVLLNLFLNAIESMEEGGTLSVDLQPGKGKSGILVRVSDTGTGIYPEDLPHIFDPYFTTKASGTGIGLAIVYNIIEAHNGDIKVESRPGQGSRFEILLPGADGKREFRMSKE